MTMHMEGPALSTTSTKKRKVKMTIAKKNQLEYEWQQHNRKLISMNLKKISYEEYLQFAFGKGKKEPVKKSTYKPDIPMSGRAQNTRNQAIIRPEVTVTGALPPVETKIYTGDKMLGISVMHKSNMVPVFSDESAKDIAKMRRG